MPQITLESSRTRKMSAKVCIGPDDLWKAWVLLGTTCPHSYHQKKWWCSQVTGWNVSRNAFSAWHVPSHDVIGQMLGSGSWNFQGGCKKRWSVSYIKIGDIRPVKKKISLKNRWRRVASTLLCLVLTSNTRWWNTFMNIWALHRNFVTFLRLCWLQFSLYI